MEKSRSLEVQPISKSAIKAFINSHDTYKANDRKGQLLIKARYLNLAFPCFDHGVKVLLDYSKDF